MNNQMELQSTPNLQPPQCVGTTEFDPFANAKPCSPFYLYNHDSPRPSTDHKSKPSIQVSLRDLETGSETLTPSVTQEKLNTKPSVCEAKGWRGAFLSRRCQQQLTKPKEQGWLKRMPKKQRMLVKLAIALVVIGCMVGIAVGIAVGLKSTVWKGNNQQADIHT